MGYVNYKIIAELSFYALNKTSVNLFKLYVIIQEYILLTIIALFENRLLGETPNL